MAILSTISIVSDIRRIMSDRLFLDICRQCYHEYSKRLKEKNAIDFEDILTDSAKIIREQEINGKKRSISNTSLWMEHRTYPDSVSI